MIRFLLDGETLALGSVDPTLTVLEWLRAHRRRTGTKEGCAEGDCGACTVVLGELAGDAIRYRAVNGCILFMPMLDGKELLTVESLGSPTNLHPVQQTLADLHGSQCGFCTPGFVMSVFARYQGADDALPCDVDALLAGNLCRCTGYGPIRQAALDCAPEATVRARFGGEETIARLRRIAQPAMASGSHFDPVHRAEIAWRVPRTESDLAAVLADHPNATLVAGATDVGLWVTKQHRRLDTLVFLGEIESLRRIERAAPGLRIGAGVKYSDAMSALADLHPDLGELIVRIGSVQIRNSGTIGGNIANGSPIGDMPPALIALGASLTLTSTRGQRTLPLEDFFIAYGEQDRRPGEYVSAVTIPHPQPGGAFRAYKISKRFDQDISAVCAAFSVRLQGGTATAARLAFGGMASTPKRASACEAAIEDQAWTAKTIETAAEALAQDFQPLSDHRASARYRLKVAQNLLRKFHIETTDPGRTRIREGWTAHA